MEEMIFRELADLNDIETSDAEFEFLLKITRPLKLQFPEWSGIMQMVQNGTHSGELSIMHMPMIDIPVSASDMSCIYSTLHFVAMQ
ncbi:hypothetical protein DPMN_165346 [Dreissena polymorpha]|uniref:Uncharacterized protein n=1 Tax=Dreissena polymorpha TaxID=45954 RepID=A0A9D4EZH6_DREPO|nr:hypothetical protein DPMN_165346 [Dreissena polymorpha]